MKIITIGDTHGEDFWKLITPDNYDKIIFVGDYVDSYTESNVKILHNLKEIIELKKAHPDKVELLIGNHCAQYINSQGDPRARCSGYRPEAYYDLHDLYTKNKDLFQLSYQIDNYIWSHAGIHRGWYNHRALGPIIELGLDKEEYSIADQINGLYKYNKDSIYDVGFRRGGFQSVGGPLWADFRETFKKPLKGYHQIVGHTPIKKITTIEINKNTSITYCDYKPEIEDDFYIIEI